MGGFGALFSSFQEVVAKKLAKATVDLWTTNTEVPVEPLLSSWEGIARKEQLPVLAADYVRSFKGPAIHPEGWKAQGGNIFSGNTCGVYCRCGGVAPPMMLQVTPRRVDFLDCPKGRNVCTNRCVRHGGKGFSEFEEQKWVPGPACSKCKGSGIVQMEEELLYLHTAAKRAKAYQNALKIDVPDEILLYAKYYWDAQCRLTGGMHAMPGLTNFEAWLQALARCALAPECYFRNSHRFSGSGAHDEKFGGPISYRYLPTCTHCVQMVNTWYIAKFKPHLEEETEWWRDLVKPRMGNPVHEIEPSRKSKYVESRRIPPPVEGDEFANFLYVCQCAKLASDIERAESQDNFYDALDALEEDFYDSDSTMLKRDLLAADARVVKRAVILRKKRCPVRTSIFSMRGQPQITFSASDLAACLGQILNNLPVMKMEREQVEEQQDHLENKQGGELLTTPQFIEILKNKKREVRKKEFEDSTQGKLLRANGFVLSKHDVFLANSVLEGLRKSKLIQRFAGRCATSTKITVDLTNKEEVVRYGPKELASEGFRQTFNVLNRPEFNALNKLAEAGWKEAKSVVLNLHIRSYMPQQMNAYAFCVIMWGHTSDAQEAALSGSYVYLEKGETELSPAFELEGYVLRPDSTAFHYDHLKTWARVQYEPFVVRGSLAKEKYVNELPTSIWFQYQSRNNDCGMICLAQVGGKKKIVGLLVAGVDQQTWADILPNPCMAEMKSQIEYEFKLGTHTEGYTKLGYLTKDKTPHLPKKNSAVLVKPEYRIDSPVPIKEPSVISVEDPRCPKDVEGKPVDPIMKAFEKKFTTPMDLLEDDILESIAQEMVEEWQDCESEPLRDVPLEVAINGVPGTQMDDDDEFEDAVECFKMRTSPGYPYVLHKEPGMKGKEAYFELAPDGTKSLKEGSLAAELYENIVQYSKSAIPELVVIECPKDELLKSEKIKQGACRLFEIMPLHYNLFLREKTLAFSLFQQRNRHKLACQVGTKAYSHDWTHMYQRLVAKSDRAINCDYSGFDGLLNSQVVSCIANMINSMYHSPEETVVSKRQRYNMINALFGRLAITGQEVMRVRAGLPSGFALTVVINSVFNEILMRYCFKVLVPSPQRNSFSTYVTLLVYGDDNLMSCTDKVATYFNGETIKTTLKRKNVTITDGSDKTSPVIKWKAPGELDFLKRRFLKLETGVVQAPLDLTAIFSCLHWVTPHPQKMPKGGAQLQVENVDTLYELALNVQVALTELYLHGDREEFQRVRNFYVKKMNILPAGYYTWADREAFHMSKQTGMEAYQPAKEIDLDVGQEFARFMHTSDIGNQVHFYTPVLGVSGPFYKPTPDQLLVSTTPLKQGECGYWVPVETGMGIGSLPTISWVHRFMRPTQLVDAYGYKIWETLRSHVDSGKSLIFRSEAPYVAGNAALMAFGQSAKLLEIKAALNLYRNVIPESTYGLEQYFDAAIPQASLPGTFYLANAETESLLQEHKTGTVVGLTTEKTNLNGARDLIMQGQKLGKLPIMAATQAPNKFYVGLCCQKNFCPGHATSSDSVAKAFSQCWAMRCAPNSSSRKVTFEPEWRKNKILGIS